MATMLLDDLKAAVTPQLAAYVAKMMGEAPANADRAIAMTIPAILSGITGATRIPSGLTAVTKLISDPINDGSLLDQLPALYQGTMTAAPVYRLGSQLLHASFGNKLAQVSQTIAMLADVKPAAAAMLVGTMAPHILAYLGRRQRDAGGLNGSAIAALFQSQAAGIHEALPPAFGHVFGAAGMAAAGNSSTAAIAAGPAPTMARAAFARPAGAGLWAIFPIGLALGTGLIGLGSLIADRLQHADGPRAVAATQAPTPVTVPIPAQPKPPAAPVAPATTKPAEAKAAPVPQAAPTAVAKLDTVAPAVAPAKAAAAVQAKPAETKSAVAPPAPPAQPTVTSPKGTTTFFGSTPSPVELPARPNPDYVPAPVVAAVTTIPPAPSVAAVAPVPAPPVSQVAPPPAVSAAAPVPSPGVTTYFGRGEAAAAPRITASTREACQSALKSSLGSDRILFETAKAELTKMSTKALDRVAAAFKSCQTVRLKIEGHTDGNGAAAMNQALSEDRAREVAEYLITAGIDKDRISAVGFGPSKPVVPNTSAANRALNRRIDLVVD